MKFDRRNIMAALSLTLFASASSPAFAEDAKTFTDTTDTKFSVQYINSKPGKKADKQCLAVYKVLDVIQIPEMQQQLMSGDVLEVAYGCNDKNEASTTGSLPWADLKSDGMVAVHMPSKYLRRRATTSAETIWRIDNKDNQFGIVKPKDAK